MAQLESHTDPDLRCACCAYVMPSESSATGLRCGLKYFTSSVIARKFLRMQHYPEVQASNACEAWQARPALERARED